MHPVASHSIRHLIALALTLLLTAGLAGTASAAGQGSITYVKDNDIWLTNPDGTGRFRVTWDGTADSPYRSPSQADNGTIAAGHLNDIVVMKQNGEVIRKIDPPALVNSASHPMDGAPVDVAISPNARIIAWSFVGYECDPTVSCGTRTATGYTDASGRTPVSKYGSTFLYDPSWVGNTRTIQSGGYGSQVMLHDIGQQPVHWFDDDDYAENSTDLSDSELSPDGRRVASVRGYGSNTQVFTYDVTGNAKTGPAPAVPSPKCGTSTEEGIAGPTWAPDSDRLAWQNSEGIWTGNMSDCENAGLKLVVPGGTEPDWGPARIDPSPGGIRLPFNSLRRALKKGLAIDFISIGKGRVEFTVKLGRRVIAADHGTAPNGGPLRAVLKIRRSARKRLAGMKKASLTISLTQKGKTAYGKGLLRK
ncbi:MAG: hypothetical protein KDB64_01545 [Solirubrobacterales bacterium]|nr:hypothetical protein [Solirubrobacterales bacterium]